MCKFVIRYVGLAESTASDATTGRADRRSGIRTSATTASWTGRTRYTAARAVRHAADAARSGRLIRLRGTEHVQH